MFISVSLATTEKRKVRSNKKPLSNSTSKIRRVSESEFLKLSPRKQKAYLTRFPQSSHRFLLKKASAPKVKKISRATYDNMTSKEQRAYDKAHKGDKKFRGKKHIAIKKVNPILEALRKKHKTPRDKENKLGKLAEAEKRVNDAQRSRYVSELKSAITPEAMKAIATVTQDDLHKAADNLQANKLKVIEDFENKLERDRLEEVEISDDDKEKLKQKIANDDDVDVEELEEIVNEKKPSAKQKKAAEDALGRKPSNFFTRDLKNLGAIIRGEKVDNNGKSNFVTGMAILGRFALIAGGVTAIALGGAPMAIYIAKEILDNWSSLSADEKDEFDIGHAYDAIVDHLRNLDLEVLGGLSQKPKFVSTSATKSRISYRCIADERMLPFTQRTVHRVMLGGSQIGEIRASNPDLATPNLRMWTAHITGGFDPLDFPHLDDPENIKEPYVLTNDDSEVEHNLELHCPLLMTLQEARNWVCQIVEK